MAFRKLDVAEWRPFLDLWMSRPAHNFVDLEVASPDLGDQLIATGVRMLGMTYDPRNDLIEIALDGIDHLVRHPREIFVDGPPVATVLVRGDDGALQIVRLFEPLLLTARAEPRSETP